MTQPMFTPGPWVCKEKRSGTREVATVYCTTGGYSTVTGDEDYSSGITLAQRSDANLLLILAAPEMYDMLETIENDDGSVPAWLWERIQTTLAKARGEAT